MRKIKNWYKNLKFRNKVLLSHLLVSMLPVIVLGIFCYIQCRNLLVQREMEMLSETLNQNATVLNGNITLYKNYMNSLIWNHNLQQAINSHYADNVEMYVAYRDVIDPIILNMENMDSAVNRVTVYSTNDTLYSHGEKFLPMDKMAIDLEELQDYQIHWYADPNANELNMYCKMYSDYKEYQNVIYISLDYQKVFSNFTTLFSENYGVVVTDQSDNVVFSFAKGILSDNSRKSFSENRNALLSSDRYVIRNVEMSSVDWNVVLYQPINIISALARGSMILVLLVILICGGMVAVLSMILTRSVSKPLSNLVANIEHIGINRLSVDVVSESQDEIGHLFSSFKNMVDRLNFMINEVYQSKILQQEYEMKALQAQINPHFLYNSLSLINWKAILADQKEISEMAQLLSTFYRTTLNRGKNITTVKGEWDNTCSYVKIQQMLHSGKFEAVLKIDEEILDYEILNLLLQPLIENAIIHGLDHKVTDGSKKLEVLGKSTQQGLIFIVYDNGCGMTEETRQKMLTMKSRGYGVQNVHHRVQLYYGDQYGLQYESKVNVGTKVTLTIPKVESSEEQNVQR
jgi:two-component system sensor histidine kinase YesM